MPSSEKSLKVNVEVVVSQAKAALADMAATTQKAADSLSKMGVGATKSAADTETAMKAAKGSVSGFFDSTTASVVKGIASYNLFAKAGQEVLGFLSSSIGESMRASATMAQVKQNVTNAGAAYDEISPKLQQYSKQMIQMGFDDEDTSLSVSKLMLITGDYSQALKLNQLAMDLARAKNISLTDASRAVALVTQGNLKALKEYGIELGDTATIADVLNEAQKKLSGSASAFADTTAGKMATLNEEWNNMKQQIGDAITPALDDLFKTIQDNMPVIEEVISGLAEFVSLMLKIVGPIASFVGFTLKPLALLGEAIGNVINVSSGLPAVWDEWGPPVKDAAKATADLTKATDDSTIAFNDNFKASKNSAQQIQQAQQDVQSLADAYTKVTQKQDAFTFEAASDFAKFAALLSDTKSKQADWLSKVSQGFDALQSDIKSTNSTIDTLKQKFEDAGQAFQDFVKSTTQSSGDDFAKIVHDAETALPDLRKQLSDALASGNDTTSIQKQIDDKNSILKSAQGTQYTSNAEFMDELSFLRSQDGKNELDQAYALMQRKIQIKQQETLAAQAQIQQQITLEQQKAAALNTLQDIMTAKFKSAVDARTADMNREISGISNVVAAVNKAKDAYNGWALSMGKINITNVPATPPMSSLFGSMSGSTPSTLNNSIFSPSSITYSGTGLFPGLGGPMPARAMGGPVEMGGSYLVGENGPELFTPRNAGQISPNGMMPNVTLNITFTGSVAGDQGIKQIITQAVAELNRQATLRGFAGK